MKSWLCSSIHLSQMVISWYTATGLYITLHSSSARLDGAYSVQIHLIRIRLITAVPIIKSQELRLYEMTL